MTGMPTQVLKLLTRAKGGRTYYFTQWVDDRGARHQQAFGSVRATAQNAFSTFAAKWKRDRAVRNPSDVSVMNVRDAVAVYQQHADAYYLRPDGTPTGEAASMAAALAPLVDLFGDEKLSSVDMRTLEAVRVEMVRRKWAITTINARVHKVRAVFRWFVEQGHFEASTWYAMKALRPLKPGRGVMVDDAAMTPRVPNEVTGVPEVYVDAVLPYLSQTIGDMIRVQLLTGMRPGEVCMMRPVDIDRSGAIWLYSPRRHKTAHHGKARTVHIGPRAQRILSPYLSRRIEVASAVFSPRESFDEFKAARRATSAGVYQTWPSYQSRERSPRGGAEFDRTTYARAIARACDAADIPRWAPNRLRHAAGLNLRRSLGLDAAQAVLGHAKIQTTERYAKITVAQAVEAMEQVG